TCVLVRLRLQGRMTPLADALGDAAISAMLDRRAIREKIRPRFRLPGCPGHRRWTRVAVQRTAAGGTDELRLARHQSGRFGFRLAATGRVVAGKSDQKSDFAVHRMPVRAAERRG